MSKRMAIVMAAGKGTRMKSELPKVLIPVCGRAMIHYVLDALEAAGVDQIVVVVGYGADLVRRELAGRSSITFALQEQQLGTGHAVMVCRDQLTSHEGPVLVVAGDSPLMQPDSIGKLFEEYDQSRAACILGTGTKEDPHGLGRVIRGTDGKFEAIVEEKDATAQQRQVKEVNLSCYVFDCRQLLHALEQIRADNSQREYYITDCPGVLKAERKDVRALNVLKPCEALSINTMDELAVVERTMREMQAC